MTDLPAPLVSVDVDLRDFAFMPLDVVRLRDSDLAANERPECCWAAVLLWAASWHQVPAGSMPDDDRWIAKQAGYAQRGKIAREWMDVRDGALHGWVKCSDGRLYHPVVVEKAREAWKGKLKQRHASECARIKKHNQRHKTSLLLPSFEEWMSFGCPWGQSLPVPRDKIGTESERPEDVPRETPSKGQGEGQGYRSTSLRSADHSVLSDGGRKPPIDPKAFLSVVEPSGAAVPTFDDPTVLKRDLFARGKAVLGASAGGQITKLLQRKGGNVAEARAAIEKASNAQQPQEYVARIIRGDDTGLAPGQLYDRSI